MTGQDRDPIRAERMRERVSESTLKVWLLMELNRWVLAGALLGFVLVVLLALGRFDPVPLSETLGTKDPIETLFQAMVGAIITGVTIVVTLNQLVLTQELGSASDQFDRMSGSMDFRQTVEAHIDEPVSPADPAAFLRTLVDAVRARATALSDVADSASNEPFRVDVDEFVRELTTNADQVTDPLKSAEFGSFQMLNAALNFNYSARIHDARKLRAEYEAEFSESGDAALEELLMTLQLFGPAREYIKALYFQWELVNLSRAVLYTAIPAFVTAGSMILFFDNPGSITGTTAGTPNVLLVTTLATVVTISPFVLLLSYILRIATMAKHTLAIGPFILSGVDADRTGDSD